MEIRRGASYASRKAIILTCFILAKFLLQWFLFNPDYDLQRDEYLYFDQCNHLAWGYLSVPPVTSWIGLLIRGLGSGLFWFRFFPALFGALTIVVVWKTIEALKGNLFSLILGSTCLLLSVMLRLNQLFQPNSIDVLAWTTLSFTIVKYLDGKNAKWLYAAAVVFAIGFLNKYNILFLLMGLLPAILISSQRRSFLAKDMLWAIVLALVLISPNLIWQITNHFPVLHHMKELTERQLVHVNRGDFLRAQVFFFAGGFFVLLAALYALLLYRPFERYKPFFWTFLFTLLIFLYFKAKDYYAIGLYPIYLAFGSAYLGATLNTGWKRVLRPVLIAFPILIYLLLFDVVFSLKSPSYIFAHSDDYRRLGLLRWEDGKNHELPQDFSDMLGWKQLALRVDSVYSAIPANEHVLILCDNYGEAGAINYYSKHVPKSAVSFNADYINWMDLDSRFDHLIRVKESKNAGNELQTSGPFFQSAAVAGAVTDSNAREYGTTIFVFKGAKIDIRPRIQQEILKTKNK